MDVDSDCEIIQSAITNQYLSIDEVEFLWKEFSSGFNEEWIKPTAGNIQEFSSWLNSFYE